jgi:hypothetical protein
MWDKMRRAIVLFMSMGFIVVLLAILANTLQKTSQLRVVPNEKLVTIEIQEILKSATTAIDFANKNALFSKGIIPMGVPIPIDLDDETTLDLTINDYSSLIVLSDKDRFIEYMNTLGVQDSYLLYDIVSGLYDYDIKKLYPHFKNPLDQTNKNPKLAFIITLKYYLKISKDLSVLSILDNHEIMTMFAYKTLEKTQICQLSGELYGYSVGIEFLYNIKKKEIDEISFTINAKNS